MNQYARVLSADAMLSTLQRSDIFFVEVRPACENQQTCFLLVPNGKAIGEPTVNARPSEHETGVDIEQLISTGERVVRHGLSHNIDFGHIFLHRAPSNNPADSRHILNSAFAHAGCSSPRTGAEISAFAT